MALVLNEEQVMLKDAAAGFLAEKASLDQLRTLRDSGDEKGFAADVWQEMADMGWAGIAIPEAFGGLGYGYTGLGLVLEQTGRNLSASPLQSTVLVGASLINALGSQAQKEALLPGIAAGERLISLALPIIIPCKDWFGPLRCGQYHRHVARPQLPFRPTKELRLAKPPQLPEQLSGLMSCSTCQTVFRPSPRSSSPLKPR